MASALASGETTYSVAKRFDVALSTPIKLKHHIDKYKTSAPLKTGRKPGGYKLEPHREQLMSLLQACPDMTLEELRSALKDVGIIVGHGSVFRYLEHIGFTLKKRRCSPPNKTDRMSDTAGNNGKNIKAK